MSQWTTLSLILTLGLILVDLSAEAAAAADDLPRNIELKPGAAVSDEKTATDTNTSEGKTRQIVTEAAAAKETAPTDPAGKPDTPKEGEGASVAAPAPPEPAEKATPPEAAPTGGKPAETPPPGPSPVELKPRELALAVQTELKRVGCYPDSIDGVWGGRSREALARVRPCRQGPRRRACANASDPRLDQRQV